MNISPPPLPYKVMLRIFAHDAGNLRGLTLVANVHATPCRLKLPSTGPDSSPTFDLTTSLVSARFADFLPIHAPLVWYSLSFTMEAFAHVWYKTRQNLPNQAHPCVLPLDKKVWLQRAVSLVSFRSLVHTCRFSHRLKMSLVQNVLVMSIKILTVMLFTQSVKKIKRATDKTLHDKWNELSPEMWANLTYLSFSFGKLNIDTVEL